MLDLTFEQFNSLDFKLYEGNPVIKNPWNSFVIADPSVVDSDISPDGKIHLFAHGFFGVYHYVSDDGISFCKVGRIVSDAMRPNINLIDSKYYLFFEKTRPVIFNLLALFGGKWESCVYCVESDDLKNWSKPYPVINHTRDYETYGKGYAISNPFLLSIDDKYRMYYSCGQTFIDDCGFFEPTHISFAESDSVSSGYISREKPVISPDKESLYLNLCSGCLKVYRLRDCYIGLQNGIYKRGDKSHSGIVLLKSEDGINFEYVRDFLSPQICGDNEWMAQYVYACCLSQQGNKLRLYFNARNTSSNLTGRESIGIFEADI